MFKAYLRDFDWNFYSKLIILIYSLLQILRWPIFPQFMDMYYHILTAWGFIQAGGYSGWDFWQYAPLGRVHIYPPVFHIILAFLIKLGISKIILAKFFETIMPIVFLIILRHFLIKNYSERLAFFTLLTLSSSFSFYLSLINNIPATLAISLGLLAFGQLFQKKLLRSTLLLVICFYTHIGVSWFFIVSIILYGLFNQEYKKTSLIVSISVFILSFPIIVKQLAGLKFISLSGIGEKYLCEFKTLDYILGFFGLLFAWRMPKEYRLFLSFFCASFIFLPYPYRFFSTQGYLPIIFLSAIFLDALYEKIKNKEGYLKYVLILLMGFILFFSPTVLMEKANNEERLTYKIYFFDSAFINMILPDIHKRITSTSLWVDDIYLPAVSLIKNNSSDDDIIYSNLRPVSVCLASISGRATASALFPEIDASEKFNPLLVSKIIIITKDEDPNLVSSIVAKYKLIKLQEDKLFIFYKNPLGHNKINIKRASVPFSVIIFVGLVYVFLFWQSKKIEKIIYLFIKRR